MALLKAVRGNLFGRASVDGRESRERRKDAGLPFESNEGRRRWTWRMWRAHRQTSSTAPDLIENELEKEKERLTTELHLMTQKRNEQRACLIAFKEGSMNKRTRPLQKLNPFYKQLILKKNQVMSSLHKLQMENIEAQENIKELKKEINYYTNLHSRLMMEKNLIKMSVTQKRESKEVQIDWALIEKYLVDLNLNGKDEQEQTSNHETQQLQDSETPARAEISTFQEESLLQNEFPPQETPAELHSQYPQSTLDESNYIQYISSV
ncbi:spermatogenesis associated glutamate (E)-rich protein 2 isoform 1 [Mus musculus]|uniref:Spermatogenesis associated glutamate (E)-rich protein 2 n=2 Tax=Mus musculus TaxID=10090 RepID=E9Q9U2_MOUSE|nr:spermatogenesis associated glutamate (E)-rich protein 2 isoform 1 [Mus musculus]|eukprot:NP_775092.3 spermatogenesis associated glutamate (E)-rich protein 2 [Mus musculus]